MKIDENDTLIFDSGLTVEAKYGAVGISSSLCVFDGAADDIFDYGFTKAEKIELADFMIERWTKYKDMLVYKGA